MKVRVVDGPFSSFQGIVTDVNKSGTKETRVKITTSLFDNGISTIVIPISFIEPI
jgi:transcription antitermination factor NusG